MKLAKALYGLRAKINLIPLNPVSDLGLSPPSADRISRFHEILLGKQFTVIVRKSKGSDICAACGQLQAAFEENSGRRKDEKILQAE